MSRMILFGICLLAAACCTNASGKSAFVPPADSIYTLESPRIKVEIDKQMRLKIFGKVDGKFVTMNTEKNNSHYIVINGTAVKDFAVESTSPQLMDLNNSQGKGKRLELHGRAAGPFNSVIEKILTVDIFEKQPNAAQISVAYKNVSKTRGLNVEKEINNRFTLDASGINKKLAKHDFWILQGGSYKERPDWIMPVTDDFSFDNYQGQQIEKDEAGGGLPVIDVWCKDLGFFIGSLSNKPLLISLPAKVNETGCLEVGIEYNRAKISFDSVYQSLPTIIGVHNGDYYNGLKTYADVMSGLGLKMLQPTANAYDPIWCSWGFGEDFTTEKILELIPLIKEFGFKVVTIDAGWFYYNGDYTLRDDTFPNGETDMKRFVKILHENGFKVKIWFTTCVAGKVLAAEHPDWLILDKNGKQIETSYANRQVTPMICPAYPQVKEYYRELMHKLIGEWDFDGYKIDQNIINAVSECYNPAHHHESPEESFSALPEIFEILCEETLKIKPDAILEVCPCGTFPSFYNMPYYNQPVASDFNTPWQIRHRGKTIKALMGAHAAYYGDHYERHFEDANYPSMIGVGGVPGSMFVLREEDNAEFLRVKYPSFITPERKEYISKWLGVFKANNFSDGEYLNLYDIAYDKPETHAVKKESIMYYAFYEKNWSGNIEFRGLDSTRNYIIKDYVNDKVIGTVKGNDSLFVSFQDYLLVEAVPQ